ncbi:MAG: PIN domain-containing protein [Terracidiphilus sp.]
MSAPRGLVLDANILLRAIFGTQVRRLLNAYEDAAAFYTPDICVADARKYIPSVARRRGSSPHLADIVLSQMIDDLIHVVDRSLYEEYEERARARIATRDDDDWPVVATALLIDAPIWTEDRDFFGSGIATWTSDRIELCLRDA